MATTTGVDDELLLKIAEKTPENKLLKLALKLKIKREDANRYCKSNHVNGEISTNGTWSMLCDWRENTKEEDQQTDLKRALEEAQLKGVADEFFGRKILTDGDMMKKELNPESVDFHDREFFYDDHMTNAVRLKTVYPFLRNSNSSLFQV